METSALTEGVFYILLSLVEPLHGYGIMQKTEVLSHGRVRLAAGTLYGALNTMLERGWIRSLEGEIGRQAQGISDYKSRKGSSCCGNGAAERVASKRKTHLRGIAI
jgi:hypothetical protein